MQTLKRIVGAIGAALAAVVPVFAQPAPSPALAPDSLLRAHAYALRLDGGRLAGPGADSLAAAAGRAEFVLVGEQHGTVEVPRFVGALLRRIRPAGYRYLALEVAPADAALLADLARAGDPRSTVVQFRRAEGSTFPFYSEYAEDAAVLAAVRTDSVALWGLDQAFASSTPSQLARLADLARTPAARALALDYHARDIAAARADTNGRGGGRFFETATAADFRALRDAFRPTPPEATRVLDELEESAAIYRANYERDPGANERRARLMKRHLRAYLDAAARGGDRRPKVLFKMGAVHTGRGLNPLAVYDVGNAVSELAELGGTTSFHVGFFALDPGDPLLPALGAVPAGAWAVLDLRPLRPVLRRAERAGAHLDPDLVAYARRYDALILAPRLTRSALLPPG